jgi:uncharacterized protein (TIGR02996 family)
MGLFGRGKRFPRRLRWPLSDADLTRMARAPSYHAPHPAELLDPGPFVPPGPPPMPAEERALLDAVLADSDADEPRLRYADWLDRRGDPWGKFIRAQIAGDRRADDLLTVHGDRWRAVLAPWSAEDVVLRRGFVEAVSLSGRAFISISDGLFRTAPVRDVRLVAVAPFMAELARAANLARLTRLSLRGNRIGPAGARELVASPYLTRLRELDLTDNDLDEPTVQALRERFGSGLLLR